MNALQTRFAVGSVSKGIDDSDNLFVKRMKRKVAGRTRPQTAKPVRRKSSYVVDSNSSMYQPSKQRGTSRIRPRTAPSRRGMTSRGKTMELANKQSNLMRLVMKESARIKGLNDKINKFSENKNTESNFKSNATYKIGSAKNPHPTYPLIARKKGWEGRVIIQAEIDREGNVSEIKVLESSGFNVLDNASLETLKKWNEDPENWVKSKT